MAAQWCRSPCARGGFALRSFSSKSGGESASVCYPAIVADYPITIVVTVEDAGQRLDQFLAAQLKETSRARIQQLIAEEKVLVNHVMAKASLRLRGGEIISIVGEPQIPPLRAIAEEIPLDIVYEDADLAVINKPAGMMVHAGAGATESARNKGTLVNALLHHFKQLSSVGGELRPGIVHRLDKETSGLILVAKNDESHRRLAAQFSGREVKKTYIALVHGWPKQDRATIRAPITRDAVHRTRMTTRGHGGREAITHYMVTRRIESPVGKFALLEVRIDTGRTHQIRVHLSSVGHSIVGDTVYGAPRELRGKNAAMATLSRNFLHAANLQLVHPRSNERLEFSAELPPTLQDFLKHNVIHL